MSPLCPQPHAANMDCRPTRMAVIASDRGVLITSGRGALPPNTHPAGSFLLGWVDTLFCADWPAERAVSPAALQLP